MSVPTRAGSGRSTDGRTQRQRPIQHGVFGRQCSDVTTPVIRNSTMWSAILIVGLTNVSCLNPFAPKLDTQPAFQTCADLTSIENVLCTFRNAYAFKDTILYSSIMSPEFSFIYRDYDHAIDISWGRSDELRTTYSLFQSVQSLTLVWNNEISSTGTDLARTVIRGFNLTVTFNPNDITRVDGYANLTFERPSASASWQITRWRDESNF